MTAETRGRLLVAVAVCVVAEALAGAQLAALPGGLAHEPPGRVAATPGDVLTRNPEEVRDPFLDPRNGEGPRAPGDRPAGLAGLTLDDVVLRGLVLSGGAYLGVLEAAAGRSYVVRGGERLLDGVVLSVGARGVVFRRGGRDDAPPGALERDVHLTIGGREEDRR